MLRRSTLLPAALLLVVTAAAALRIASAWPVFSHTTDEGAHMACGLEWLEKGTYTLEAQHPPLARAACALLPYLAGERLKPEHGMWQQGMFLLGWNEHYDRTLALGRAGNLPFLCIGMAAVFWCGWRAGGPHVALAAAGFYSTVPVVLGHAGLATTDTALAAFVAAAAVAGDWWAERPTLGRAALLGVITACAVLSKFSALAYLPAIWALTALLQFRRGGLRDRRLVRSAFVGAAVAALVIGAGYRFAFGPAQSLGGAFVPAPAFFDGVSAGFEAFPGPESTG